MNVLGFSKVVFGLAAMLFLLAPLAAILPLAFTDSVFLNYPIASYSTRWFNELVTADVWRRSIINSLIIGFGTTVLATVLGTLAALGLRRQEASWLFAFARTAFLLPMVVPAVVLGGVGTLVVTGLWIKLFPGLANRDRMVEDKPPAQP